jgi:hypothetical protein
MQKTVHHAETLQFEPAFPGLSGVTVLAHQHRALSRCWCSKEQQEHFPPALARPAGEQRRKKIYATGVNFSGQLYIITTVA